MKVFVDRELIEHAYEALMFANPYAGNYCEPKEYEKMIETQHQLKRILDQNPEPLVVKDDNGEILQAIKELLAKDNSMGKLQYSPCPYLKGEQRRVTTDDGDYIYEWNGEQWFKKYQAIDTRIWTE